MTGPQPDFTITHEWKELVHYREGDRDFVLDAGWGVTPPVLYVPDPSIWDAVVPDWLVGRCEQVTQRLREHSGHVVALTTEGYPRRR